MTLAYILSRFVFSQWHPSESCSIKTFEPVVSLSISHRRCPLLWYIYAINACRGHKYLDHFSVHNKSYLEHIFE